MEAFVIVFVFAVALGTYVYSRLGTASLAGKSLAEELVRLEEYREVLRKKARRGQLEKWDGDMMNRITGQLAEVERRIAQVAAQRYDGI